MNDAIVLERITPVGLGADVASLPLATRAEPLPEATLARVARPDSAGLFNWLFGGVLAHPSGAIAGWRSRQTGQLSDEYPEITGYYLSAAVFARATENDAVRGAAAYLCARIESRDLASRRVDGDAIYNFDLGIIAAGLLKYGVRAGDARALRAGLSAATSLRDQISELGYLPTFVASGGMADGRGSTWSTVGQLHLAKTVQSLLLAADLGFDGMLVAARTLIDRTRRDFALASPQLQEASGRINLHATCYALEGLWIWDAHQAVAHDELLETSLCTLASYRLPSGGLPRNAPGGPAREQCDVLSQVIRLAALLGRTELVDGAIARLRDIALSTDHGWAMPYQPEAAETHENAWASMFAAQALTLVDGDARLEWWQLI